MTRDDNVLLNDVYFNAYNTNPPLTPLTPISKLFASFEGIGVHSGVPTRTTPTLTPTTLKNIEQTIIEATSDAQVNLPYQAGFVPPPYPMEEHSQDRDASQESLSSTSNDGSWHVSGSAHGGYTADDLDSKSSASLDHFPPLAVAAGSAGSTGSRSTGRRSAFGAGLPKAQGTGGGGSSSNASSSLGTGGGGAGGGAHGGGGGTGGSGRRNVGGRRPHKPSNLSPEEEEKRRIRRERNKQAAARCRRRREDHTNLLVDETDQLEKRRQSLHQEIQALQQEKDDLEFLLESHRDHCRLRARLSSPPELKIKTEPEEEPQQVQQQQQQQQAPPHQELQEQMVAEALLQQEPPSIITRGPKGAKKLKLSNDLSDSLETPTPTTLFAPLTGISKAAAAAAAAGTTAGRAGVERPHRPDSLDVKSAAQFPMLNIRNDTLAAAAAAVGISTPSNGLFNFDSLMEGGTGLTPIAAPITLPPNRNPLELITPTSTEPSKLCSL